MKLHSQICFNELIWYVSLCHEYGIKKVLVERDIYQRIKILAFNSPAKSLKFMGVTFNIKQ
jgi:hypothetical protein